MSNYNYLLLFTQTKQDPIIDSWVRFKSVGGNDYSYFTYQSVTIALSPDLIDLPYTRTLPEENNSNLKFYDAKLNLHFIKVDTLEYNLFIDNKGLRISDHIQEQNIPEISYIKLIIKDVQLTHKNTNEVHTVPQIDIYNLIPITNKYICAVSTVDLEDYYFNIDYLIEYPDLSNIRLEAKYEEVEAYYLKYINLPISVSKNLTLQLFLNGNLVSESQSNKYDNSIPALNFSLQENQSSNLEDISSSLLVLLYNNEFELIYNTLNGLVNTLSHSKVLSEQMPRYYVEDENLAINLKTYCLLLFHLSIINQYKSNGQLLLLSKYLIDTITKSLNHKLKNINYGYDNNGQIIYNQDFSLLFLSYLALTTAQEYLYQEYTEFVIAILQEHIDNLLDTNFIQINNYDSTSILEGMFWASLLFKHANLSNNLIKISILFKYYIENNNITSYEDIFYYNYTLHLHQESNLNLDLLDITYLKQDIGDILIKVENISLLRSSNLHFIYINKIYSKLDYQYINYTVNALVHRSLIKAYLIKYLPYGLGWFSTQSKVHNLGILNALLEAITYGILTALIKYYSLLNKIDIDKAQGIYLEEWGSLYSIFRRIGERDYIYRNRIKKVLHYKGDSLETLDNYLKSIDPTNSIYFNHIEGVIYINSFSVDESFLTLIEQLNYIGVRVILLHKSTYKVNNNIGGIFYAGINNYS